MRIIAVILSVYVVILTAMPCFDAYIVDTSSVSLKLLEQSHNYTNDVDLCSPFCFCNCCQTLSQPEFYNSSQFNLAVFSLIIPLVEKGHPNSVNPLWHPPKN